MARVKVVFISGYKRTGKDTFASWLVSPVPPPGSYYSLGLSLDVIRGPRSAVRQRFAFAEALKEEFYQERGVKIDELNKEIYRAALVEFATAKKELHGESYYARNLAKKIAQAVPDGASEFRAIVSDFRFPEEYRLPEYLSKELGYPAELPYHVRIASPAPQWGLDWSETALDHWKPDALIYRAT